MDKTQEPTPEQEAASFKAANFIWYGSGNCDYWTDDFSKLKTVGPGIPCCPICGRVGFQIEKDQWDSGAADFEKKGHPGYVEKLNARKEKCPDPNKRVG